MHSGAAAGLVKKENFNYFLSSQVAVAVLTFSSLVFFAEKDSPTYQWTFIDSFWWGLMTLTTGRSSRFNGVLGVAVSNWKQ
jgi:hypothetical protein